MAKSSVTGLQVEVVVIAVVTAKACRLRRSDLSNSALTLSTSWPFSSLGWSILASSSVLFDDSSLSVTPVEVSASPKRRSTLLSTFAGSTAFSFTEKAPKLTNDVISMSKHSMLAMLHFLWKAIIVPYALLSATVEGFTKVRIRFAD